MSVIKQRVEERWKRWLDRRIPTSNQVVLNQRSIFIVPSKVGGFFLLLLALLLITAINYQNSLIYGLTFWLFSIFMTAMFFTFRNLSGLQISSAEKIVAFAGDQVEIPIRLIADNKGYDAVDLFWPTFQRVTTGVRAGCEVTVALPYSLLKRGSIKTERFKVESVYPLGLYTCWSWVRINFSGLVYPKPEFTPFIPSPGIRDQDVASERRIKGNDEFVGLRDYQKGDPIKHIAWKYLAKGKGLLTKEYDSQPVSTEWLDWNSMPGVNQEKRLSRLCGWILQAEQQGKRYGLKTPVIEIPPSSGDQHREKCLSHLALYGFEAEDAR